MSEFINNNEDALRLLADKVKEVNTVRDCETLKDLQARKIAINLVESWIEELFGIKRDEFRTLVDDEPNIYNTLKDRSIQED